MHISPLAILALLGVTTAAPSISKRDHWKQKYDVGIRKRHSTYYLFLKLANSQARNVMVLHAMQTLSIRSVNMDL